MNLDNINIESIKESFSKLDNINDLVIFLSDISSNLYDDPKVKITKKNISYFAFHKKERYNRILIPKKNGTDRVLNAPVPFLKMLQRCLNTALNIVFTPHYAAYGFVPNKSIAQNAQQHINRNFVFNVDLLDFFGNIQFKRVKTVLELSPFNLNDELAFLIANLCCYDNTLPQGAPTSPTLSNVVCQKLDRRLTKLSKKYYARYTRYADDITFSSRKDVFDEKFVNDLCEIIEDENFKINPAKTRLQDYTERQVVTGLTVNEKVNVSQNYVREVRAMLHNWSKYGYKEANRRYKTSCIEKGNLSNTDFIKYIVGKLNFLKQVKGKEDKVYQKYKNEFDKLLGIKEVKEYYNSIRKIDIDNSSLQAKNIPRFFELFYNSKGIKYLTHDYDIGKFDYYELLKTAKIEIEEKIKDYPIPRNLFTKIRNFAFAENPNWGSENIKLGWREKKFQQWSTANNKLHQHPSQDEYWRTEMIGKFQNSIEIRKPMLKEIVEVVIEKKLDKKKEFIINLVKLDRAAFYTDVDQLKNALRHIFEGINDYSQKRNIEISFDRNRLQTTDLTQIIIKIADIGSEMNIEADVQEFKGSLRSAMDNLRGLCEWYIEAKFNDGFFRLHLLNDNSLLENTTEPILEKDVLGVTHFLYFYR